MTSGWWVEYGVGHRRLGKDEHITFGRDSTVDVCFPSEKRLSRLAGSLRSVPGGMAITNLSTTHDLYVVSDTQTICLAASGAGAPVASLLLSGGRARITWPGSRVDGLGLTSEGPSTDPRAGISIATGTETARPLKLNPDTKEFAVALVLCLPRLIGGPGATTTANVPELTREILDRTNSFRMINLWDTDAAIRHRLVSRTHDHLKTLRRKLRGAGLARTGTRLPAEAIANLLVTHNVVLPHHVQLLADDQWLNRQEVEWED